jgi:hypothetical protein
MKGRFASRTDGRGIFIIMKKIIRSIIVAVLLLLLVSALPIGVSAAQTRELIVAGTPFGVKIQTEGVIVVGIPSEDGPASAVGLR